MQIQSFNLKPFPTSALLPAVEILGELCRYSDRMSLRYVLRDPMHEVALPATSNAPARQDELWTTTCLELFFGPTSAETYWEVNVSPAGHWNVYRFDAYRSGMREESALNTLPFEVERQASELHLQLDFDLSILVEMEQELEVAIATVLQFKNNQLSYWALTHPGPEADFHRRDSFILKA